MEYIEKWASKLLEQRIEASDFNKEIENSLHEMIIELENQSKKKGVSFRLRINKVGDVFDAGWNVDLGYTTIEVTAQEIKDCMSEMLPDKNTGKLKESDLSISEILGRLINEKYVR